MATIDPQPSSELNLREQIARIDNLLMDSQKKQREFNLAPWQVFAALLASYAAVLAAGTALGSWIFGR